MALDYSIPTSFTNETAKGRKFVLSKKKSLFVSAIFKAFRHLTFFMTFHVVTMPKFGQIYNVKYLSFHLTPSLPTFMKIDITYENRT